MRRLRSWRTFWCVFSLAVHRVRDSAARNLNRGGKRKRWGRGRGEKAVRKIAGGFSHCLLPLALSPMSFSASTSVSLLRGCNSYFSKHKRKNTTKNRLIRRLSGARSESERRRGRKRQEKYRDFTHLWKIAFPLLLFPRLPSPTSIFASRVRCSR